MTLSRFLGGALFASACAFSLGCNDGGETGTPEPSPKPALNKANDDMGIRFDRTPIIAVTDEAKARIAEVIRVQHISGPCYVRLRVLPGTCVGFQHKLDLDADVSLEDRTSESNGVKVVVLKRQVEMLRGARIDYVFEGGKQGFKVQNPNFEGDALKKWLPILEQDKWIE